MFVAGKLTGVNNMTRKTTPVSPGRWTPRWPCTSREEYLRDLAEFSEVATQRLARRVAERAGRPEATEDDWYTARAISAVRTQAYVVVTAGGDPAPYNRILARLLG